MRHAQRKLEELLAQGEWDEDHPPPQVWLQYTIWRSPRQSTGPCDSFPDTKTAQEGVTCLTAAHPGLPEAIWLRVRRFIVRHDSCAILQTSKQCNTQHALTLDSR